jgi:hypothetical protein
MTSEPHGMPNTLESPIEKLWDLHKAGALSAVEFERGKSALLAEAPRMAAR